jgi:acetyl esterase
MPLHAQVKEFLDALREHPVPGWDEMTPAQGRQFFASLTDLFGQGPALHRVEDRTVADTVAVRIYAPAVPTPLPIVMFFHGGGWVLGDLNTHDSLCRRLCAASGALIVSVAYRCAPEHQYPAALDDCLAATAYVADHAAELGGDAGRIVVAGDSAGGNLAAAVALRARDQGGPVLHGQILIYPAVQACCDSSSYLAFADGYGLTRRAMLWFWRQYLGQDLKTADAYAAPGRATSLAGLPPTHLITAEYDVLRDEGEQFAGRLQAAGVPTTARRYNGMIHGFVHFAEPFDVGKQALADLGEVVRTLTRGRGHHHRGKIHHETQALPVLARPGAG